MAARRGVVLQVLMNGLLVGHLRSSSRGGVLSFGYADSWLETDDTRAISLSLPLRSQEYSGQVVENYFDNLLPDSQPIRSRLQVRVGADSTRCFDLLAHIGRDCIGALQLMPEGISVNVQTVTANPVGEKDIAAILGNYQTMPLGIDLEADFRISVAGAQEKTAFLWQNDGWHRPTGATPTSHLFKLPIGEIRRGGLDLSESVENEWLCCQILRGFGLPIASVQMMIFGTQKVLVVERFDRRWSADGNWLIRLPQEDMCQAVGVSGSLKYESDGGPGMLEIMDILLGSVQSYRDRSMFMTAQLLFWMLAAIDGHAKNFSIFNLPGGGYRLTPLYDVISVYPLVVSRQLDRQRVNMAMAARGKNRHYRWDTISRRHWLETARKCRFSADDMDQIIDSCCDRVDDVIAQASSLIPDTFPQAIADPIFNGIISARDRLSRNNRL